MCLFLCLFFKCVDFEFHKLHKILTGNIKIFKALSDGASTTFFQLPVLILCVHCGPINSGGPWKNEDSMECKVFALCRD